MHPPEAKLSAAGGYPPRVSRVLSSACVWLQVLLTIKQRVRVFSSPQNSRAPRKTREQRHLDRVAGSTWNMELRFGYHQQSRVQERPGTGWRGYGSGRTGSNRVCSRAVLPQSGLPLVYPRALTPAGELRGQRCVYGHGTALTGRPKAFLLPLPRNVIQQGRGGPPWSTGAFRHWMRFAATWTVS
jgi:hypothetical protein